MEQELIGEFIRHSINRIEENTKKVMKCLDELDEKDIWIYPNESSNSMGNLMLHLCGNIRQYIISSLGGKEDIRERDKEFSARGGLTKNELISKFTEIINEAKSIINSVDAGSLLRVRSVQVYEYTGLGIIYHVVEHYSYHTGQIIFFTKMLKNKDLAIYAGIDLNRKNRI
jgi:uncharacterized damage-inducible protein DinB